MKNLFAFAVLAVLSSNVFAAPKKCILEIDDQTMMPQGPVETPVSTLQYAKAKGYTATLSAYPQATKKGEYTTSPKVTCLNNIFNPFFVKCETKVRVYNHLDQVVAEGKSSDSYSVGSYSGDVAAAINTLPDCKDL